MCRVTSYAHLFICLGCCLRASGDDPMIILIEEDDDEGLFVCSEIVIRFIEVKRKGTSMTPIPKDTVNIERKEQEVDFLSKSPSFPSCPLFSVFTALLFSHTCTV